MAKLADLYTFKQVFFNNFSTLLLLAFIYIVKPFLQAQCYKSDTFQFIYIFINLYLLL